MCGRVVGCMAKVVEEEFEVLEGDEVTDEVRWITIMPWEARQFKA